MLLSKLESGFLRFETPQGLAVAEPAFWQRVYLLWTFRNFHQLSPLLLNPRQTALINDLFRQNTATNLHEYEPDLEIGIVENFVPSAIEIDTTPTANGGASRKMKPPEQSADQSVAARVIPMAPPHAMSVDGPPALKMEAAREDDAGIDCAGIEPKEVPDDSFVPTVRLLRSPSSNFATFKVAASRQMMYRFAAAIAAVTLCVYFASPRHRIGPAPGSQTHNSVPQLNSPAGSPSAPTSTISAVNLRAAPELPDEAVTDDEAPVEPSPPEVASSTAITQQMTTPARGLRVPTGRVARPRGGSHAGYSRVPTSNSTRRMTLASGSRETYARSSKTYFDLADQQLHKGNYAAAAANYRRAWRIEEHIAAAKGRLARARLTTQAKKGSIANRTYMSAK